ncbi:hypothetical protein BKA93DRAFT_826051 [Sparassis latifolia]
MLPKVASHIGRAVAAVHSQTTHAVRNALQLQSSSGPAGNIGSWNGTSSSSGWGNYGAGSGGAKYHAGSRFQGGYTGPGRAITQAEPVSNDARNDDDDDVPFSRRRGRTLARRKSLSFITQERPGEKLRVLKTVQSHVRSFHAVAEAPAAEAPPAPPPPALVAQRVEGQQRPEEADKYSNTALYNAALVALSQVRKPGESLQAILETYNEMLSRSILPNMKTYSILIHALTDRDHEIQKALPVLEWRASHEQMSSSQAQQEIEKLQAENNFGSAFTLFQTVCAIPRARPTVNIYNRLLRSCAIHSNVDAAIYVFAHLEQRKDVSPTCDTFRYLIEVYTATGDINGAKEVFEEYKDACHSNRISWKQEETTDSAIITAGRCAHLIVYNTMIEAYIRCGQSTNGIGLLEQMLDSKAGPAFAPEDIPNPCAATYARMIHAFCVIGDVRDALAWFERLLQQDTSPGHPFETSKIPTRPPQDGWNIILGVLADHDMVADLNRLFARQLELAEQDGLHIRENDRVSVLRANLHYLDVHPEIEDAAAVETLDFLANIVLPGDMELVRFFSQSEMVLQSMARLCLAHNHAECALGLLERYVAEQSREIEAVQAMEGSLDLNRRVDFLRAFIEDITGFFLDNGRVQLSLEQVLRLAALNNDIGVLLPVYAPELLSAYKAAKSQGGIPQLSPKQWGTLINASLQGLKRQTSSYEAVSEFEELLRDVALTDIDPFTTFSIGMLTHIVDTLLSRYDFELVSAFFASLGPKYDKMAAVMADFRHQKMQMPASTENLKLEIEPPITPVRFNMTHSKYVDQFIGPKAKVSPLVAYHRYKSGLRNNNYPRPEVIAQLIGSLGRSGEVEKMHELYQTAQLVLASMEGNKKWQSVSWFQVEDYMVIGLAHAGDLEAAHVHRMRILEQGGTPSADAYGALIHLVKDTTDDTSNAMALWQESQARGVVPNIYLYNTIISKLAKARKADHALELFQQMKTRHLFPTSVTYGAVIAACCRVGDVVSAEVLFDEMLAQRNFKPRVPPYNTMMQLYTHTKPDRERVLYYFNALQAANVKPTAHTYKLLIDAYGCIEPVDIQAMESNFESLTEGEHPMVQGTHWAALINAYGCVQKNLEKALAIFDSIATHPSTLHSGAALPDAVVFEALINVLVTLRRPDLIPVYTERLVSYGVHMTAYIANLLIKGYASTGDIERAREIFESLADPPEGVAAPHNHAPHDDETAHTIQVPVTAPVYREPSTWEAMVRAELGNGNRDNAVALLNRVQARKFPPAVYNRISGIMLDDSVSPWPSSDSVSSPTTWATTESSSASIPSP